VSKCGYFCLPDMFDDDEEEEARDCEREATHTSCNYGNVCEDHMCRCSKLIGGVEMKQETKRKVNRCYDLDSPDTAHIAHDGVLQETLEFEPEEVDITLDGLESLRITNSGEYMYGTVIEVRHGSDGEWIALGGVQSISVSIDVECPVPKVKIERYLYGQGILTNELKERESEGEDDDSK